MILLRRRRTREDPLLQGKVWIFGAGAVLALLGIGLESGLLVISAIVVLLAGFALRFLAPGDPGADQAEDQEEAEEGR